MSCVGHVSVMCFMCGVYKPQYRSCACACMHPCVHNVYIHACMHVCVHTCVHACVCVHVLTNVVNWVVLRNTPPGTHSAYCDSNF